jgi:predicted lipoprotein with Yx(FWY)xxD motif
MGVAAAAALAGCNYAIAGQGDAGPAKKAAASASAAPAYASPEPSTAATPDTTTAPAGIRTDTLVAKTIPKMGKVVTDSAGFVLYRFDRDAPGSGQSACTGACTRVWPPLLTDGEPTFKGVDPAKVGAIIRADGGLQVTLSGWPLYRYIGDPKPGAWKGQGVGGTWWVSAPDGKKNLTCVPKTTPQAASPPPDTGAPADGGSSGGYNY